MAEKASRTPVQRKVDSQLLFAGRRARGEAIARGVQRLDVRVPMTADGRVMLDVRADVSEALLAQLRGLGGEITEVAPRYRTIGVTIGLDQVEAIAALDGVSFVNPKPEAIAWGNGHTTAGLPPATWAQRSAAIKARKSLARAEMLASLGRAIVDQTQGTNVGSRLSEGDATHKAATARSTYGISGAGVKIGVLSDDVCSLASSQGLGDLGAVTVLPGQTGTCAPGGDEGTAMLEIIHDLAPDAQLYFATAFTGLSQFAQNIRDLRTAGCDIIVDDVFYYVESPFQDGQTYTSQYNGAIVIQAVKDVAADGALYFSSAGNSGNLNDGTSGTWEGDFVDGGPAGSPIGYGRLHRFGEQTYTAFTTNNTNPINLSWSDPLGTSSNDYDLFVLDATGLNVLKVSDYTQDGNDDPYEHVSGTGLGVGCRVVIVKYSGSDRFLHLGTSRRRLSIATSGETHGHSSTSAANSFSVAATPAVSPGPYPSPFNASNKVETFSSDGPRRIFYNSSGAALTPGNVSSTGGQVLNKPDLTAADGVAVTGVGTFPDTFYGTSAAAPHAGAIAALAKSKKLGATASEIRTALIKSAIDIEAAGLDRDSGVGIIMADTAVGAMSALLFTDDPLVAGATLVKAVHVAELRARIDALRARNSLGAYSWNDSTLSAGTSPVRAVHITDMRTALTQAYVAAMRTAPTFTDDPLAAGTPVRAVHITELRAAVIALE